MGKAVKKTKSGKVISEKVYRVIKSPIITEKSTMASQYNKVTFNVSVDADKASIKDAVEKLFDVKVVKVNTIVQKGKLKTFKGIRALRSDRKKAIVTLAEGETVDITTKV